MNRDFSQDAAAGRYLQAEIGSTAARLKVDQLHAEATTRRMVHEYRRTHPVGGLRPRIATMLRRIADRLAPVPREARPVSKARFIGSH